MRENPLKAKLGRGETIIGLMCFEFSTSGMARLADAAGADFVLFDMEHTGWGMETVRQMLAAAHGTGHDASRRVLRRSGNSCRPRSISAPSA